MIVDGIPCSNGLRAKPDDIVQILIQDERLKHLLLREVGDPYYSAEQFMQDLRKLHGEIALRVSK